MEPHGWILSFNEYYIEDGAKEKWEEQLYELHYQFMAHPRQDLFGPGIHEDGTIWWHTQLPVRVNYKMASEIKFLLHYATEYTLFTKIWMAGGTVEKEIADKGWHFVKKKRPAVSLEKKLLQDNL
ncbi:2913_t:CDS:2 [Acaulospora morrowiae]|uniref:2913_t:CDS:1 n=1 Tax=Acaulospora morrowiae TaxID=94023 RepID=A0A9N8Z021_9GLOM|nr:2913_t:CDS:2 [Acaulospora morrowiae]